jgi:type VI secretion system protein ImpJ
MTAPLMHWHEGMFLRPHHFQAAERYWSHRAHVAERWDHHYGWGLRDIEIDPDALANHRFVVRSVRARLRDGTLVSIPEDGAPPALDLKGAIERDGSATVYLAVPGLNLGRTNIAAARHEDHGRFLLDTAEVEDENTGVNPQRVQVRRLNLRLLASHQNLAGYEVLPVARVEKSAAAAAAPQIDTAYIPPVLACDAWKPLSAGILEQVFDRIGKKQELLAAQMAAGGIGLESHSQGDRVLVEQLRILNEAAVRLNVLAFAQGIHPLTAYLELVGLVGRLAIFDPRIGPRAPAVPNYDHDDLGGCFYRVKQYLHNMLDAVVEPDYKSRLFVGAGLRMQVQLEPSWLEANNQMFVGVKTSLSTEECVRLLTRSGQLDLKVGSSERVDDIYRQGGRGLIFTHVPVPPRPLPSQQGLVYFRVHRDSDQREWHNVCKALTLAIRLNERHIEGNIQGQEVLKVRTGGQSATLGFTLYVAPLPVAVKPPAVVLASEDANPHNRAATAGTPRPAGTTFSARAAV